MFSFSAEFECAFILCPFFLKIQYVTLSMFQYSNLANAIGPYSYTEEDNSMPAPLLCLYEYKEGDIFGFNESYVFNSEIEERKFILYCKALLLNICLGNEYLCHVKGHSLNEGSV
jgi:hypothetical protein